MTNLYKITKQIYELLTQINKKYSLDIKIKPTNLAGWEIPMCFIPSGGVWQMDYQKANKTFETDKYVPILFEPQIRQILFDLKDVLGGNPECEKWFFRKNLTKQTTNVAKYEAKRSALIEIIPQFQAEALCQKWLDGLNPLFNREPKTVLTELVKVLEKLLK